MPSRRLLLPLCLLLACATSCATIDYDLAGVPIPVSAKPIEPAAGAVFVPFRIDAKYVLWAHGLFGATSPDIAALVIEQARGYDEIANFRVRAGAGFHDWLIAHLSGTLVRMKSIVIEGDLVKK